jgi:hypothetical protein
MIGKTLTIENLQAIYEAMSKIQVLDRSLFFEQYYNEVIVRMGEAESTKAYLEQQAAKNKTNSI